MSARSAASGTTVCTPSPATSSQMAGSRAERAQTRRALSKLDTPVKMVLLATTQIHSQGLPGRRVSGRSSAIEHPKVRHFLRVKRP